jgi:hypothetical protein
MVFMRVKSLSCLPLAACLVSLVGQLAMAQVGASSTPVSPPPGSFAAPPAPFLEAQPDVGRGALASIFDAAHPDFNQFGVPVGGFTLLLGGDLKETYTSNVYITTSNVKSDFYSTVDPTLALNSNWSRDALGLMLAGDINRYDRYPSEDTDNFTGRVNGRLDVLQGVYFIGSGGYQILHEPRDSPDNLNGKTPTEYRLASGSFGYIKDNAIIGIRLDGTINNYNYTDVMTSSGLPIDETLRNRTEYEITGRVSYEIAPGYHAFVSASGNDRVYDEKFDYGGYRRGSTGYQVDAGAALSITAKVDGEIYIGYLSQSYDDARLRNPSDLGFGAKLLWNVDGLTSIRASVSRTVQETIVDPASSILETDVSLGVEHELMRNVLLGADLTYSYQEYQGLARVDEVYGVDISGKYLFNHYLSAWLDARYHQRASNSVGAALGANYNQTSLSATLRLQL